MFRSFLMATVFIALVTPAKPVLAQAVPAQKTYNYLIYHKLAPGMTIQDALPVEREWKAINQAAVDEGNLVSWGMSVKQMTSNPNPAEYDYVTRIVSHELNMKGASPAAMTKLYGDSVKTRMADLQKRDRLTAPVVKVEIWEVTDMAPSEPVDFAKTPLLVLNMMRRRNPATDFTDLVGQLKRQAGERVAKQELGGWVFSQLRVPNGSEKGYELAIGQHMASLNTLVNPGGDPLSSAAQSLGRQANTLFEVVRQEVFRYQEFTTKP